MQAAQPDSLLCLGALPAIVTLPTHPCRQGRQSVFWHLHAQVAAVDTNGAGDTFATAYMLALATRSLHPGYTANWAASRAVMQAQACKPGCIEAAIKRDSRWARLGVWLRKQVGRAACGDTMSQGCLGESGQQGSRVCLLPIFGGGLLHAGRECRFLQR